MQVAYFSDGQGICFYSERTDGDTCSMYHGHKLSTESACHEGIASCLGQSNGFEVIRVAQYHSNDVVEASHFWNDVPQADGIVSGDRSLVPTVMVADCVPVGLYDKTKGITAAVHAGWKGLVAGVIENAIDFMTAQLGASEVEAVIGPHICARCYEFIGPESQIVAKSFGSECFVGEDHSFLDLSACVKKIFDTKGVSMIYEEKDCTLCSERFFSYRGGDTTQRIILGVGVVGE